MDVGKAFYGERIKALAWLKSKERLNIHIPRKFIFEIFFTNHNSNLMSLRYTVETG